MGSRSTTTATVVWEEKEKREARLEKASAGEETETESGRLRLARNTETGGSEWREWALCMGEHSKVWLVGACALAEPVRRSGFPGWPPCEICGS